MKNNVKINIVNSYSCFHQIGISDIKLVTNCEARHYTTAGGTDQSEGV